MCNVYMSIPMLQRKHPQGYNEPHNKYRVSTSKSRKLNIENVARTVEFYYENLFISFFRWSKKRDQHFQINIQWTGIQVNGDQ